MQREPSVTLTAQEAAAEAAYAYTDAAGTFPAPEAGWLSEILERWSSGGKLNIFNQKIHAAAVCSTAASGAATYGILRGGDYGTVFTSSTGILPMLPSIRGVVRENLPAVYHILRGRADRFLCSRAEWEDTLMAAQAFPLVLCADTAQRAYDLGILAHLTAMKTGAPVLQLFADTAPAAVSLFDLESCKALADWQAIGDFRKRSLLPEHPAASCQFVEKAQSPSQETLYAVMGEVMEKIAPGVNPFCAYVGAEHPETVLLLPAHLAPALERLVDQLGDSCKLGLVKLYTLSPVSVTEIQRVLPAGVRELQVLEVGTAGHSPLLYPPMAAALAEGGYRVSPLYLESPASAAAALGVPDNTLPRSPERQGAACKTCGADLYLKLLVDLLGERLVITRTPGCATSRLPLAADWKADVPQPVVADAPFEESAAFALGVHVSLRHSRAGIMEQIAIMRDALSEAEKTICDEWIEARMWGDRTKADPRGERLRELVTSHLQEEGLVGQTCRFIQENLWDLVFLKSEWVIGGDGWAFDSGVSSIFQILSMDENINLLILNNQCLAQTGRQTSKASPKGMKGGYYAAGKRFPAMDLAAIARSFPYVYAASIDIQSDPKEAEAVLRKAAAYNGPALILANAPCGLCQSEEA